MKYVLLHFLLFGGLFSFAQNAPENSFICIHCDPDFADETHFNFLQIMIDSCDARDIPLTLQFTPQWADLILNDPEKLDSLRAWQQRGHEVSSHHHGIYHCYYDGYTNYPLDSVVTNQQELGQNCPIDTTITSAMLPFWNQIDSLAGPYPFKTWSASDENPAIDMYPDVPYRTDGGRESADQAFSSVYTAQHGPTTIGNTTYGPYNTCSIDYYFIDDTASVNEVQDLYNDSLSFSGQYSTVGVVTHVFDFKEASIMLPPSQNFFYRWINFIEDRGNKTVSEILDASPICAELNTSSTEKEIFTMYPNPAENYVTIKCAYPFEELQIEIFDIAGNRTNTIITNEQIDISSLETGIYYVTVTIDGNTIQKTLSVLK